MNAKNSQLAYDFTLVSDESVKDTVEVYQVNFMIDRQMSVYVYVDKEEGTIEFDTDDLTFEEADELFNSLSRDFL